MNDQELDFIKWLVEVLHYPFDVQFETPAPVDHGRLAEYWNTWDRWNLDPGEAFLCVASEAGLLP